MVNDEKTFIKEISDIQIRQGIRNVWNIKIIISDILSNCPYCNTNSETRVCIYQTLRRSDLDVSSRDKGRRCDFKWQECVAFSRPRAVYFRVARNATTFSRINRLFKHNYNMIPERTTPAVRRATDRICIRSRAPPWPCGLRQCNLGTPSRCQLIITLSA